MLSLALLTIAVLALAVLALILWRPGLVLALAFLAAAALPAAAQTITPVANTVIDQSQGILVAYLSEIIVAVFFGFLAWITKTLRIKVVEYFNRDAILKAVTNFGNANIDLLQARYLKSSNPDLADLVTKGIQYVQTGSPDAVAQSGMTRDRLATIVEGALRARASGMVLPLIDQEVSAR